MSDYFICPVCGTEVDYDAIVCPECGSDDETGWSEETRYDGIYFYDDEPAPRNITSRWTRVIIILVLGVFSVVALANLQELGLYLILVLILGGGAYYYWTQIRPQQPARQEEQLLQTLLRQARGDRALAERLIEYEQQRNPDANRQVWIADAIDRWERDRR